MFLIQMQYHIYIYISYIIYIYVNIIYIIHIIYIYDMLYILSLYVYVYNMYIIEGEPRMIVGSSECTEFPQDPKLMGPAPRVARCHKHGSLWKLGETQNSPVSSGIL